MSLVIKIIAAIVGLLVAIIAGIGIYLSTVFDANDYKAEIQALVKQQTALELAIAGELKLSVFPWLGVSINDATLSSTEGRLASIGHARIFAKFTPLLTGQVEIDGIALRDMKLNLVKNAAGQGNWQLTKQEKAADSDKDNQPLALNTFSLGYLKIDNAEISYRDISTGEFHQLQNLNLQVSNASNNSQFPLSAEFGYLNKALNTPILAHLTSQVELALDKQELSLNETVLDIASARINSELEIQQLLAAPFIDGKLTITEFKPAEWSQVLQQPALADMTLDIDLSADFQIDTAADKLAMQKVTLESPEFAISTALNANDLNSNLSYISNINIQRLNPKALLKSLNITTPETSSNNALNSLTGRFDLKGSSSNLLLSNIHLKLDETLLRGEAGITDLSKLATQFALTIDSLNLDHYLPPSNKNEQDQTTGQSSGNEPLLPLDQLRDLRTQGQLSIGKLIASGQQIDNLKVTMKAANGFINLSQLTADLYGGSLSSSATIDARGSTPQFTFNNNVSELQASALITSFTTVDYLDGQLNLSTKGTAYGNSLNAIKKTLTGNAEFKINDGLIKGTNVETLVCKGIARARERQYLNEESQPNTQFKELVGRANIIKGVVQTEQLQVALNNLQLKGSGTINLPDEKLDFGIRARIQGDLENQACEVHERYRDIDWPIRCQGNFSDEPSSLCGIDQRQLQNIIAQLAQKEIQRKAGDAIKEKLGDEAGELFKGILGL